MIRGFIDECLSKHEELADNIKEISKQYTLADFIKVDKFCEEHFQNNGKDIEKVIQGCMYCERERKLFLDFDKVEGRLAKEYMEFLHDLSVEKGGNDKIFYIVAFHYLMLCKEWRYQLTIASNAPFPFFGNEMTPLAKRTYAQYEDFINDGLHIFVPTIFERDLQYYNTIYRELSYHHHATKHFSLLNRMVGCDVIVDSYKFNHLFKQLLDVFVFRYKAIYTTERLYLHMDGDTQERIVGALVDLVLAE